MQSFDRSHRRSPLNACAAQQLQQQGFGLVVLVMGERDEIHRLASERLMAQFARGSFDAHCAQGGNVYMFDMQGNAVIFAQLCAERCPCVSMRADAVMHMKGGEFPRILPGKPREQVQQYDGIQSAA